MTEEATEGTQLGQVQASATWARDRANGKS